MKKNSINPGNLLDRLFTGNLFYVIFGLVAFIYLRFPTNSHLADSFDYGASVKYGYKLFSAHHLLYNSANYLIFESVKLVYPPIDALRLMQFTDAIFALLCLLLLRRIISKQTGNEVKANVWTFFAACSFGVMRFAVEAETYIIPIFFSLLSSNCYFNYLKTKQEKNALYSGFFASVACLFHQIHLFWGIGLFIGFVRTKKLKNVFLFAILTPLVLIVYSIVLVYYNHVSFTIHNLLQFLAQYYFSDNAKVEIGMGNLIVTLITFVRTFFQVHGTVIEVLKLLPATFFAVLVVVVLMIFVVYKFFKTMSFRAIHTNASFEQTHLMIFVFQLGFAFFSYGNSEFMVMLPFLIAMFINLFVDFDLIVVKGFALCMLIWNTTFSIFPNYFIDYQNNKSLISEIKRNPDKIFILEESYLIVNQYFYEYGIYNCYRIVDNTDKPAIKRLKKKKAIFYTDILTKKVAYSRVQFTTTEKNNNLVFVRHVNRVSSSFGGFYIDEVKCLD